MSVGKHVDFGMVDEKGRKIGARVRLYTRGEGFAINVEVWATRDGETFGRVPPERYADNMGEAVVEVQRRVRLMFKRYAKKLNLLAEGCHAKWVDPETGMTLTLRDSDEEGANYDVICEAHSTVVNVESKRAGRSCSSLDFCDDCRAKA